MPGGLARQQRSRLGPHRRDRQSAVSSALGNSRRDRLGEKTAIGLRDPGRPRDRVLYILKRCDASLRGWVLGALINSAFIAFLSGACLWMLGVPLVLANAAIAGVLNFIPNIGPALSVIPPIVVALTDEPWKAGAV
ncbi:MAG: AI-2E family transporter, partial [Cyanobacteria bacterium J06648_11]